MSFARPTRLTESQRIEAVFDSLPIGHAYHQVCDAAIATGADATDYATRLHNGVMALSHVYAMTEGSVIQLPIASFRLDPPKRTATMVHLLAKFPLRADGKFGRTTSNTIRGFCAEIFKHEQEIDTITIPGHFPNWGDPRMNVSYNDEATTVQRNQIAV